MIPLVVILSFCFAGLAESQFMTIPMPVPLAVPQMVPVYVPMPMMTLPTSTAVRPVIPRLQTTTDGKGKTYYKTFNDRLPGGVGRGAVYEYSAPGQHEYSKTYSTSQSFGSPLSGGFANSDSNTFSNSFSTSWGSDPTSVSAKTSNSPRIANTRIVTTVSSRFDKIVKQ
ncbi:unnamed protein product [Cylicocyclus nassatus]|uniref:Uncharacterized protein n=1 Tax=Cylicocyclus nassatus TaxID=53992 RepID=A0AA36DLN3_CYLNA|nr:unnamed protein product [Cylicocyclus nassatus]